ncbi:flagellar protein FlaG [uncultured Selenomonas sp.]|uniref:flagellar protein FlaG n=1 Tax=uncultured Selenomonas sp. TaxID=159275 RepID=UPI0028E671F7|nr:flagellar protein FlaG [uncultured Selenomonas sp.]
MTVKNVQDVMLAAVAVSGMKGADTPSANASEAPAQEVSQAQPVDTFAAAEDAKAQDEAAAEQKEQHEPLSEEQTAYITEQLNEIMRNINVDLQFQYHKEVNFMSVRMLDKKTGEVLREVPPEAMVEHMIKVHDWIGAFLDKTA